MVFNNAITASKFLLKWQTLKLFSKKGQEVFKKSTDLSVSYLWFRKFLRIICKQLQLPLDNILSKYQCGFKKSHGKQHCQLLMLEKWKTALDNKERRVA